MHSNALIWEYYCIYNDKTVMRDVMESEITFTNDIVYFGVTPQGVQKMCTLLRGLLRK
jgi:hypothetical protein